MIVALRYESRCEPAGTAHWVSAPDGDTPTVQLTIRLLGIDAPEIHYPGTQKPSAFDSRLENLLKTHRRAFKTKEFRDYLAPRLAGRAGTRQLLWAERARAALAELAEKYLRHRAGGQIRYRNLALTVGEQLFDQYQRLLAYVAPEEQNPAKRVTLNLLLMQEGWAVNYIIYPNLPTPDDWAKIQQAVRQARTHQKGFWKDETLLLGYEYRFCVDTALGRRAGPDKYCVDVTTGELYAPHEYHLIEPENRLFILKEHLRVAKRTLKGLKVR